LSNNKKVIIVGGGAAGMMAAGTAGNRGLNVILIEKNRCLGKKVLISGNGRCNISNTGDVESLIANVNVNPRFLYSAFYKFSNVSLIKLLHEMGLETKVEEDGKIFPCSDNSRDVVKAMEKYLHNKLVKIEKGEVLDIIFEDKYRVILKDGRSFISDSIVIATGGISYPGTGSTGDGYRFAQKFGHTIIPLKPSLVPLEIKEKWIKKLQGLSLRNVSVSVINDKNDIIFNEIGDIIFTHYGVSGPLILSASSHIDKFRNNKYKLVMDLKPKLNEEYLDKEIQKILRENPGKLLTNSLAFLLAKKMIPIIFKLSDIRENKVANQLTREERLRLVHLLKNISLEINGFRPIREAMVTSGGVSTEEIDPHTMESRLQQGLFFAGEVIDVDACTGGYNLQIAFSTAYLAGINC
jgi:predicted Rossmann fold flavoprotein